VSIALDLTHTAHCRAQTGIQRVTRQLLAHLAAVGEDPVPLVYDRYARRWRGPDATERARLAPSAAEIPGAKRGEVWTFGQKLRGWLKRGAASEVSVNRPTRLLAPEIFTPEVFVAYAGLRQRLGGPAGAVFYDAVVLRYPQLSPPASVARFPDYLRELAQFDGVAAISEASRSELLDQWKRLGCRNPPPVAAIPLGVDAVSGAKNARREGMLSDGATALAERLREGFSRHPEWEDWPGVLCVCTIEGRKNHLALLEACESLWREGVHFQLWLAGLPRPETAQSALQRAAELERSHRPVRVFGAVSDELLEALYAACKFTVYPSLYEGFGLPVMESLIRRRPCVCGRGGALVEVAQGGGCAVVDEPTAPALAAALRNLLEDTVFYACLVEAAGRRRFPNGSDYARRIAAWLETLAPHPRPD
jgi:glycosyltransferase involved in cell wall biosynthesis